MILACPKCKGGFVVADEDALDVVQCTKCGTVSQRGIILKENVIPDEQTYFGFPMGFLLKVNMYSNFAVLAVGLLMAVCWSLLAAILYVGLFMFGRWVIKIVFFAYIDSAGMSAKDYDDQAWGLHTETTRKSVFWGTFFTIGLHIVLIHILWARPAEQKEALERAMQEALENEKRPRSYYRY